jgi:hypothetical protein
MATVSSIATAIASQLSALSWVNEASATSYLPATTGKAVCAFLIPFEQETRAEASNFAGDVTLRTVLTVEFWIQIKNNRAAEAMTTAQNAGALAIAALVTNDGDGYTLDRAIPFQERIAPSPVTYADVPWIISTLRVPVENEVTINA